VLNEQGRAGSPQNTGSQRGGAAAGAEQSPNEQGGGAPLPDSAPPTTPADYEDGAPGTGDTPSPVEPRKGELIIEDELKTPGQWLDSEIQEQDANCFTRGVMRVARVDPGTYQCVGPDESIVDDFGVEVTTVLQSAGSCAAIWFHWDPKRGGQVLRVCQDEMSVVADARNDREVYGRIRLKKRIELGQATRIHLVVRDGEAQVFRAGDFAGAVRLPEGGPDRGQVQLGMSVDATGTDSSYVVTFSDVKIQSF